MKNIPRSLPSNSFHVIAPLALFAVPENSFPRYKTGARKCTPNRVFFQKSSQSLCLLPISLYQSRERAAPRKRIASGETDSSRTESTLLIPSVEIDLTVSPLSPHRLLSRRNEPKSRGGGRGGKIGKISTEKRKEERKKEGWKKFDGYIGEGKLDFRFADNSPRLRSRRIGDESCIPPVREYASTD